MQQKEKEISEEEDQQAKNTTIRYLKSIAKRYHHQQQDIAQFIDLETGVCLQCDLVHSFTNIDEAIKRRRRENNNNSSSPYLDRLFW